MLTLLILSLFYTRTKVLPPAPPQEASKAYSPGSSPGPLPLPLCPGRKAFFWGIVNSRISISVLRPTGNFSSSPSWHWRRQGGPFPRKSGAFSVLFCLAHSPHDTPLPKTMTSQKVNVNFLSKIRKLVSYEESLLTLLKWLRLSWLRMNNSGFVPRSS